MLGERSRMEQIVTSIEEKLRRIAEERERLSREEAAMRAEAVAELNRINEQIELLEERKESLETLLGLNETANRAGHGQIVQVCIVAVSEAGGGLTAAQVREHIERQHPEVRVSSVAATLSRLAASGRMRRDEAGRYYVS